MQKLATLAVSIAFAVPMAGADNPWLQEFLKHWNTSKEFTLAVAGQMPAESYTFKPNPEEMDYGHLMVHIAQGNAYFLTTITGNKMTPAKPAGMDKAAVIKFMGDAFDWGAQQIAGLTDAQLNKAVKLEGMQMTGREGLMSALIHIAHHRGQAEVYLRVKNIKPSDYRF